LRKRGAAQHSRPADYLGEVPLPVTSPFIWEVAVKVISLRAVVLGLALGSTALSLSACGHSPLTRALTGGAIGAGAGAAVGAATGGNAGTGALVGGGIGAAGGALTAP
jgi:hypothetical protein